MTLPESLQSSPWRRRIEVALEALRGAASALLAVRGTGTRGTETGDQLKTSVDRAAEGWVLGFLETEFPNDPILAEERFSLEGKPWSPRAAYWTVDALDGTRSFVEGFPGFCVQVAWVEEGTPRVGVIAEPVTGAIYVAAHGAGAFRMHTNGIALVRAATAIPTRPRFVDSTPPSGAVGRWMQETSGALVECGSIGLKVARVAEGAADVYAKDFRFRLWDVAPGRVIAEEAGARVGLWDGSAVPFDGSQVEWRRILCVPAASYDDAVRALARYGG